jgi:hypothetical protein
MSVSLRHPTDLTNFTIVTIGDLKLAFSYETIIGFKEGWDLWIVSENIWSQTTGKHLNWLDDGSKKTRLDPYTFQRLLATKLERLT